MENPSEFVVSEVVKPNESMCNVVTQYFLIKDSHLVETQDEVLLKAARLANYYNNYKDETLLNTLKKSNIRVDLNYHNQKLGKTITRSYSFHPHY